MMALTLQQPWAEFIMAGIKPVENRVWRAAYRGVLLIHAGKTFDDEWKNKIASMEARFAAKKYVNNKTIGSFGKIEWQKGGIIGAVLMTGCDMLHNDPWCEYGCWYHRYSFPHRFKKMIPCSGKLKLFQPRLSKESFAKEDRVGIGGLNNIARVQGIEEVIEW